MTFDKVKTMRSAEKFLSQGKIRAAIDEYKKVVESDPKDFSTMNILGDLYVKASDNQEAVKCFTNVAEHYNKQGFAQKAIAIYNKVSKINPDSPEVIAKLAKLYESRGSLAEARQHYYQLADQYEKKGRKIEALAVWKQIAEVDPNNTDIYLKIGEAYWQETQKDEAADAFIQAGKRLMSKNQDSAAVAAFAKVLQVNPENIEALRGFVKAQISLGFADEAAKALEEAATNQPMNREIVYMLVDSYLEMKEPSKAELTLVRLVEKEPANYPKLLDLIQYYLKARDVESGARILTMASEHMLVGGQTEYLRRLLDELLSLDPEHLDGLRLLVRFHGWHRDEAELKDSLARLADSAKQNNSPEDERYALNQLVVMLPHEVDYAKRLHELNVMLGDDPGVMAQSQQNEDVPTFESFATLVEDGVSVEGGEIEKDDFSQFPAAEINQNGNHLSLNGFNHKDEEFTGEVTELVEASFVNEDSGSQDKETEWLSDQIEQIEADAAEAEASNGHSGSQASSLSHYEEKALAEELDSIDFYVSQGYLDLAQRSLEALEEKFGDRQEIQNLRAKINAGENGGQGEEQEQSTGFSFAAPSTTEADAQADTAPGSTEEMQAPAVEEQGFDAAASADPMADVPELPTSEEKQAEAVSTLAGQELQQQEESVPVAEEAESQIHGADDAMSFADVLASQSPSAEEAAIEAAPAIEEAQPDTQEVSASDESAPVSAFEDFRAGLDIDDSSLSGDSDYETHFNMGIAYKEMGLLEDAIKEFQDAAKFVEMNDGTRRMFECCNMLGYCFMEKGMPNLALLWYKKCLQTSDLTEDEMQGINYEIANAYEAEGDKAKASRHFSEIYAVDVHYRDVGERLQRLQ